MRWASAGEASLRAEDWTYLAEGNAHVVLRYEGTCSSLVGRVLRLYKVQLQLQQEGGEEDASSFEESVGQRVFASLLSPGYFDEPVAVYLGGDLTRVLKERATSFRPAARGDLDPHPWRPFGVLESDKTAMWLGYSRPSPEGSPRVSGGLGSEDRRQQPPRWRTTMALEIKAKGGHRPASQLVPPGRAELKRRIPRDWVVQAYKKRLPPLPQRGEKGGGIAKYNPEDLFSGNCERMASALRHLIVCPQNKLRVFWEGEHVYGKGCPPALSSERQPRQRLEAAAEMLFSKAPRTSFGTSATTSPPTHTERLVQLVSAILAREPLLSELLDVQKHDVLDVEGASLVYARLLDLCDGDETTCQQLLTSAQANAPTANDFEQCSKWRAMWTSPCSSDDAGASHSAALAAVALLAKEACVQLLVMWLLALVASDCSIMIAIQPLPLHENCGSSSLQQRERAGHVEWEGQHLAYCLTVVDIDCKPPSKAKLKGEKEADIWDQLLC